MKELLGDYDGFIANINRGFEEVGIARKELALLDHLGYRTETLEEYHETLEQFRSLGKDLGEIEVEGRPITIIALDEPIESGGWIVPFVEVIAPKDNRYKTGLEHAEFVTVRLLGDFEQRHSELNFLRDAMTRHINPELKYREHDISVKFHRLSIGTVVELEAEEKVRGE
jgi:predicted metalloenzyme YecM